MIMYGSDGRGGLKTIWSSDNMGQGPGAVTWLVGDFNGDGKAEIVQGWGNGSSLGMIMYGGDGRGGLKTVWSNADMGQGPGAVTWLVGDFNADGKPEIVQGWNDDFSLGMIMYGSDGRGGTPTSVWSQREHGPGPRRSSAVTGHFNGTIV